ncbi:MAG TPA: phosphodiesterase [Clostridia bacterium]|nr:phosphodiesterase [Clostridia bacterium]
MKLFFIADIHGSAYYLKKTLAVYEQEKADYLVILGDELYHGARNPLPEEYNPKEVAGLLNDYSGKIIAVRGNCDSEVDQMVLNYPIMSDYSTILYHGKRLFLTHGHLYQENNMPGLCDGDVFFYGHTHVLRAEKKDGVTIINPGSITLPKENLPHTFGLLENDVFEIRDLNGGVVKKIRFGKVL